MGRTDIKTIIIMVLIFLNGIIYSQTADKTVPVIAVLDFEPKNAVTADTADFITERIRIELFKTRKYKIVERKDMKKILDEQRLELSGLTGSEYASKVGKLLSAQKILLGTVTKFDDFYYINARVIDVETGVMEFGDTAEAESPSELSEASRYIVLKMMGGQSETKVSDSSPSGNRKSDKDKKDTGTDAFFNRKMADLSTDITEFVNSTIDYFINKINIKLPDISKTRENKTSGNPENNETSTNDNQVSEPEKSGSLQDDKNNSDEEYLDDYVNKVKSNRDNYKKQKSVHNDNPVNNKELSGNNIPKNQKENYTGGMGGVLLKYCFKEIDFSDYNLRGNLLNIGGRGIWMVNRFFGLGAGGYGGILLNSSTEDYSLGMGYGGLILDLYYRIKIVRFDINCLIGGGGYGISDNKLIKSFQNKSSTNSFADAVKESGSFFILEPTLLIAFRVTSFMEIGLTGGYTYTTKLRGGKNDFINYTAGISLMFGVGG